MLEVQNDDNFPQLRITHTDETHFTDFSTTSNGRLRIRPSGRTVEVDTGDTNGGNVLFTKNGGTTSGGIAWDTGDQDVTLYSEADLYLGAGGNSQKVTIDSTGNVSIGTSADILSGLYTDSSKLTVYGTANRSILELASSKAGNGEPMGAIHFLNNDNADASNVDADSKLLAAVQVETVTSDSNAGDDSGGSMVFYTKPEGGTVAARLTIDSTGDATFVGDIKPSADSTYDLGTSGLYWQNAYIDAITTTGNVSAGGNVASIGNTTVGGNLAVTGASTFNGHCALAVQGSDASGAANYAHIYAKDDSGSAEVFVRDEGGNVTKISPHDDAGEWEFFSKNKKSGKVIRIKMERLMRKLNDFLGEDLYEEYYEDI